MPKSKRENTSGTVNEGFQGLKVTPGRLQDDLEAQKRYRQDASPMALRREDSSFKPNRPSLAESYHSAFTEADSGANRATYLELQREPANHEVGSLTMAKSHVSLLIPF